MSASAAVVEDFVATTNRVILEKRIKEVSAVLAFLRSVQALPCPANSNNELSREKEPLLAAFDEVRRSAGTPAQPSHWLALADASWDRFLLHFNAYIVDLVLYPEDEVDEDTFVANFVLLLFDVPVSADGVPVYTRVVDPGDQRHKFQASADLMAALARCCRILWEPATVDASVAFYSRILDALNARFVDALAEAMARLGVTNLPLPGTEIQRDEEVEGETDTDLPSYVSPSSWSFDSYDTIDPLGDFDPILAACYHAVFGLAAWTHVPARSETFREFIDHCRDHDVFETMNTLYDVYHHSDWLLHLLRTYDFMTDYETAYTDTWTRVSMQQAQSRLECLHTAMRARGLAQVEEDITALLAAHATPTARDRAILAYIAPYAPRAAFDNVEESYNMPADSEAGRASVAGDDIHDKENKLPTAAETPSAPPARPPPARPRRTPASKRHVPPDHRARVPALLARLRALA